MNNYVLGFLFREHKGPAVLIKKQKPEWQRGLLNGVGGKIELNEPPFNAMVREFKEETGVNTVHIPWRMFCKMQGDDFIIYCFTAIDKYCYEYASTQESEEIEKHDMHKLLYHPHVSNLQWLMSMASDKGDNDLEFTAIINYKNPTLQNHPTPKEIIKVIENIENWNLWTNEFVIEEVMKYYKGRCIPAVVKEVVENFKYGVR